MNDLFDRAISMLLAMWLLVACETIVVAQDDSRIPDQLLTVAEATDYEATSLSSDVNRFLQTCAERADHVRHFEAGRTSLRQPIVGAVFASPMVEAPPSDGRLVIMLLGNIHSGECDGKEALLMLARELTLNAQHPWLKRVVFVMVPNYNADGNDRISLDNRPGQVGPIRGMGTRETADGFDLNRDFMKLETAEAKALVRLIDRWNPHLFIDCHTTNGSIHRYPLTYDVPHNPAVPESLRSFLRDRMMPGITVGMKESGYDTFYYGNFRAHHTRWESFGFEPRYSTEYVGLRGRIAILSESYSYADYKTRVLVSREFVRQCVERAIAHANEISKLLATIGAEASQETDAAFPTPIPLDAEMVPFRDKVTVLGRDPETKEPRDYEVEFWSNFISRREAALPFAYILPSPESAVLENLRNHGLHLEVLDQPTHTEVTVRTIQTLTRDSREFQKHKMVRLETQDHREIRELPKGTVIVKTTQPLARLAAWLLEPESSDGLVAWNFFDSKIEEGSEYPVFTLTKRITLPTTAVRSEE
ncbi:MAG: M14 family metallopeptidase [Planctomycetota bacterium]